MLACIVNKSTNALITRNLLLDLKNDMIKDWIIRAIALLDHSLNPVPQEINELDWKEMLSPDKERLA